MCSPPLQSLWLSDVSQLTGWNDGRREVWFVFWERQTDRRLFIHCSPKFMQKASREGDYCRSKPTGSI